MYLYNRITSMCVCERMIFQWPNQQHFQLNLFMSNQIPCEIWERAIFSRSPIYTHALSRTQSVVNNSTKKHTLTHQTLCKITTSNTNKHRATKVCVYMHLLSIDRENMRTYPSQFKRASHWPILPLFRLYIFLYKKREKNWT